MDLMGRNVPCKDSTTRQKTATSRTSRSPFKSKRKRCGGATALRDAYAIAVTASRSILWATANRRNSSTKKRSRARSRRASNIYVVGCCLTYVRIAPTPNKAQPIMAAVPPNGAKNTGPPNEAE